MYTESQVVQVYGAPFPELLTGRREILIKISGDSLALSYVYRSTHTHGESFHVDFA